MTTLLEWKQSNYLEDGTLEDIIAAYDLGYLGVLCFAPSLRADENPLEITIEDWDHAFTTLIAPAVLSRYRKASQFAVAWPRQDKRNPAAHLLYLAHMAALSLQPVNQSDLARQAGGFLGQLLLMRHVETNDPALHRALQCTWATQSETRLGADLQSLKGRLYEDAALFQAPDNDLIAWLTAIEIFNSNPDDPLGGFVSSEAACHVRRHLHAMADRASASRNFLPPMQLANGKDSNVEYYSKLGAIALLDTDFWEGEPCRKIDEYFACVSGHLDDGTVFIATDGTSRPIGYAAWIKPANEGPPTLRRQAAPFGNHLQLHHQLEDHLGVQDSVEAHHERSARVEQVAW